jgi:hypothetical protein
MFTTLENREALKQLDYLIEEAEGHLIHDIMDKLGAYSLYSLDEEVTELSKINKDLNNLINKDLIMDILEGILNDLPPNFEDCKAKDYKKLNIELVKLYKMLGE